MKEVVILFFAIMLCLMSVLVLSCADESGSSGDDESGSTGDLDMNTARSDLERNFNPWVSEDDFAELVEGNGRFALDLYAQLSEEKSGNFFFSPHSISIALAMTYAGAVGNTRDEMSEALHFTLQEETLHTVFNKLDLGLSSSDTNSEYGSFVFRTANSLWAEQTYTFLDSFLDPLAVHYGAGVNLMDFVGQSEQARQTINAWVEEQTNDNIVDLISEGMITPATRLVLTNAVYFYGPWSDPFVEGATAEAEFTQLDGTSISVPTMKSPEERFSYVDGEGYVAVELPYTDAAEMIIIMPDAGTFETFEAQFDMQVVSDLVSSYRSARMILHLPKWEFRSKFQMRSTLEDMGMVDAFEAGIADFSGMDGTRDLFVGDVVHQAFVAVDEKGTEAAAATAIGVDSSAEPPPEPIVVRINRPFIFLIRSSTTRAILFVGRVLNPLATGSE